MSQTSNRAGTATSLQKISETPETSITVNASQSGRARPDHQQIANLAYQYWEERGRPEDSPDEDWFRAEQSLLG